MQVSNLLKLIFLTTLLMTGLFSSWGWAQDQVKGYRWHRPGKEVVQGSLHDRTMEAYQRLPAVMQHQVRKSVWTLSTQSAGLFIDFQTDASNICITYKVTGGLSMPHMPTTGVSGVDLYAFDKTEHVWEWASGKYVFGDTTITYTFENIAPTQGAKKYYRLYMPLYNTIEDLSIGIAPSDTIAFPSTPGKPIIVYGTSITQGACASRPGLAWTNILGRRLKQEVVNLGFSGNGRLERPVLELIANTPAAAIILDCLPNLEITRDRSEQELDSLLYQAVVLIREKQPGIPIVLAEHSSGFNRHILNTTQVRRYEITTQVARRTFARLEAKGVSGLYLLSNTAIGLDIDSTVDYVHPNDRGMMKIANAYYRLLKEIGSEDFMFRE